jgi:parallel beta-helix repeat protein
MRRFVLMMVLITVLLGTVIVAFKIERAKAIVAIHIRADGSIDPSYAPMRRLDGDLYILTDNISSVVIDRNNMTLDGAGLTVQGSEVSNYEGIYIYGRSNVTVKNIIVKGFNHGVWLDSSSNNSISKSQVAANNGIGIILSVGSQYNSIVENNITENGGEGIFVFGSSNYNSIAGNNITTNNNGISLYLSSNNSMYGNNIQSNNWGIRLQACSNNSIYHNNFVNNTNQVYTVESTNIWDNGYPSGGNYWSNYVGLDLNRGVGQNQTGSDDIGDTPYVINVNNTDRYPLMTEYIPVISEFSPFLVLPLLMAATLVTVIVYRINRSACKRARSGFSVQSINDFECAAC